MSFLSLYLAKSRLADWITLPLMFICQKLLIMLRMWFSLFCIKYILFWFYQCVGLKANSKYTTEKVLHQPWNALMLQRSLITQITSCLLCNFNSPEATVINLIAIVWVFRMSLGNWSDMNNIMTCYCCLTFILCDWETMKWAVHICFKFQNFTVKVITDYTVCIAIGTAVQTNLMYTSRATK